MEPIFTSSNITKKFGQTIALNNVDIAIYPGEIRGFIGENGSGKSTMGALMTGIHDVTSGSMRYHGKDWNPSSMIDALSGGIGIIVQENGTIPQISVAENMFLGEMRNFSGVHFFEERKVENFSPVFSREILTEFDAWYAGIKAEIDGLRADGETAYYAAKTKRSLVKKDKVLSSQQKQAELAELDKAMADAKACMQKNKNLLDAKKLSAYCEELKRRYQAMNEALLAYNKQKLSGQVAEYNQKSQAAFDAFRQKLKDAEAQYAGEPKTAVDPVIRKRRYENEIREIKKAYAAEMKALDRHHEMFLKWQKDDVKSLQNHYLNAVQDITCKNEASASRRARRLVLTVVFGLFVNRKKLNKYAQHALNRIGINHIRTDIPCGAYDMQDRKLIEIAKCLNKNPEIFIVDETTTALSETGRNLLYNCMNELKAQGKSVLFVSHDLDEIMDNCDTLTVLRDGNIVANLDKSKNEFVPDVILKAMIGREIKGDYYRSDYDGTYSDRVVLKMVDGIASNKLKHVNLELHKGEILGIGGLSECGMHTLGKALFGNIKMEGGFVFTGEALDQQVTSEVVAMRNRIGYLPKNRDVEGLTQKDSIANNIAIASINNIAKLNIFVFKSSEQKIVNKQVRDLSIKCNSAGDLVSTLSGGNKQKVSLAKWMGNDSEILILDCPTRGVDIGVKQFIYQLMYRMKQEGKSIIMISEELPELIGMSDRIVIMKEGRITKEFQRDKDLTQEDIVKYMI